MRHGAPIPAKLDGIVEPHRLNRASLASYIAEELARPSAKVLAVLMVHLIRPKDVEVITRTSVWEQTLSRIDGHVGRFLRERDRYAFLSDEKICLVLPGLANGAQAQLAAVRVLSAVRGGNEAGSHELPTQASLGIALFPEHALSEDELVACADTAARIAADNEDGYRLYRPGDGGESTLQRSDIGSQLVDAIRLNTLPAYYQPQIEIATGRCVGAEALLRWTGGSGVVIPPGTVVGIAERSGLIGPMTFALLNTVLRHLADLTSKDVAISLSVNISSNLLADTEMPEVVQRAIETWQVPANRLTFEITESAMIGNVERSIALLCRLREIGIRLSIDDFGTGYSSLAYLKRLPLNELKIDRSFVKGMFDTENDMRIVQALIDLAHNFGLTTVAEGVETAPAFEQLKTMGCERVQGYLISHALSYVEFLHWHESWPDEAGQRRLIQ